MKKLYAFLVAVLTVTGAFAQCVIDTTHLPTTGGGIYPTAAHLPHIVRDSLYDQTVQGKIQDTMSMNFGGFVSVSIRVDSVRMDTINGLPVGINWTKNPNVLRGGGYGCTEFTGSTSDTAGTYHLSPIGMIWAHLKVPLLGIDKDTFQYGPLDRLPPFGNYYVVVDSVQLPLSVSLTPTNLCFGDSLTGRITATAIGGSPVAPYSYAWNTGSDAYVLNNVNAGTYSVTVTSGSETASATADVVQEPMPISLTTFADSSSNGTNGSAIVVATGGVPPYSYFWNNGAGNNDTATGLSPGTYRITVRDSFNCIMRDSAIVTGVFPAGIASVSDFAKLSLYPNPVSGLLNVTIDAQMPVAGKMEVMDIAGRVVYSAPLNIAGRYNKVINTEGFSTGTYILKITSGNQSVYQRFAVAR